MNSSRLGRCLTVLDRLRSRGSLSTAEAAALCGVQRRTAMGDLQAMVRGSTLVRRLGTGRDARYAYAGETGVRVTFGDRLALVVGRGALAFLEGTEVTGWLDDLAEKLEAWEAPAARRADRLAERVLFVNEPHRRYEAHDDVVNELFTAVVNDEEVELQRGEVLLPRVQPYAIAVYRRALYVVARLPAESRSVTLAVDRIAGCRRLGTRFRRRPEVDPTRGMEQFFGIWREPAPERVVLRFPATKRGLLESRRWHPTGEVVEGPPGTVELHMNAGGRDLVSAVLEWGGACQVIEPAWLRAEVIAEMRAGLEGYGLRSDVREER